MLKLLGGLCVLAGGVLAWRRQLRERRRRRDTLLEVVTALRRMGETVRLARRPLPGLLETLAGACQTEAATFFRQTAGVARQGEGLSAAWRQAAEGLPLEKGAREILAELGGDLQGDEESVCQAIALVTKRLAACLEELDHRRPEEERRATVLWLSGAALLVILLL